MSAIQCLKVQLKNTKSKKKMRKNNYRQHCVYAITTPPCGMTTAHTLTVVRNLKKICRNI
jgi:hypothetical protein